MKTILCFVMLAVMVIGCQAQKDDLILHFEKGDDTLFITATLEVGDSVRVGDITITPKTIGYSLYPKDSLASNVTKALELAVKYLALQNESYDWTSILEVRGWDSMTPAEEKRAEAKRLEQEAQALEQHDADVKFIRETLKRWRAGHE